jgi:eukaryotic-like serine/threonine-protein kinase
MDSLEHLKTVLAGRYDIEREIGAGGMATVYLARDVRHSRSVAVKVLKPDLSAVLGVERFLTEIRVTASLQHPALLPLFDSGEADGMLFYVMPFVAGESLRARLDRERQLPVDEAVRIATTVAGALEYAHQHGVIHRDLKPENILMQAGEPVVADFGIALAVSNAGGQRVTQTGLSLGTPQYMSPEQATGDRVIDARADVYSLGAVTYEMLVGDPPHNGSTVQAVIARVLTERPQNVRVLRPAVPEHIAYAVEKALEKLPADRWATAREFADVLQGRVTVARTNAASRERWRDPFTVLLSVLSLVLAVALGAVLSRRPGPAVEPIQFSIITRGDETIEFHYFPLALSPDGRQLAYVGRKGIYIRAMGELRPRLISGTEVGDVPFFSPDGASLGFYARGKLMRVPIAGGPAVEIAEVPAIRRATWTESGTIVFGANGAMHAVPAAGGTSRLISRPDTAHGEATQAYPVVLGDGTTIVYTSVGSAPSEGRLAVTTVDGAPPVRLDVHAAAALGVVEGHLVYVTRQSVLMIVPFDVRGRKLTGAPVAVGRNVRTAGSNTAAALAGEGTLAYVLESKLNEMRLVWVDEHGVTQPVVAAPAYYDLPRLSPDGKRLAVYVSTSSGNVGDYWIHEFASGTLSRLTNDSSSYGGEWLPDSRSFVVRHGKGQLEGLWSHVVDGSRPPTLVLNKDYDFAISPDGRTLVYSEDVEAGKRRIVARRLVGECTDRSACDTTSRPVAAFSGSEYAYRFSPDGHWLAYMSAESGSDEIYVRPFPGPGPRVQVSVNGGSEPVWSRDGGRIFYRDRFVGDTIYTASVTATPTFAVLSRNRLFAGNFDWDYDVADYDVAADGRLIMPQFPNADEEIVVTVNWRELLRRRLQGAR